MENNYNAVQIGWMDNKLISVEFHLKILWFKNTILKRKTIAIWYLFSGFKYVASDFKWYETVVY